MLKTVYIYIFIFLDFFWWTKLKRTAFISNIFFSLLSLFINLMHPCWIIILLIPNFWTVVYINMCFSFACSSACIHSSWWLIQFSRLVESLLFSNHQKSLWFTEFFQSSSCVCSACTGSVPKPSELPAFQGMRIWDKAADVCGCELRVLCVFCGGELCVQKRLELASFPLLHIQHRQEQQQEQTEEDSS